MNLKRSGRFMWIALTVLAISFTGCSDDEGPTGPGGFTADDADDVAVQASMSLGVIGALVEGSASGAGGGAPAGSAMGTMRLFNAGPGLGVQTDTTFYAGDVTITLSRTWYSLTGDEQTVPDATTDSVHSTSRVTGDAETPRYTVTIGHAGELGIGGLNPVRSDIWINGSCHDTLTSHFTALTRPVERWFLCRTSSVIDDVRWMKPNGSPTYPESGTITMTLFAARHRDGDRLDVDRTVEATVVVTFNGTRYPDVTVNATWHYVWDLDNGTIVRAGTDA
ncbi:MAG: hypothetical protein ACREOU_02975 [Candidatus Eiseniibacteriota bacterium]